MLFIALSIYHHYCHHTTTTGAAVRSQCVASATDPVREWSSAIVQLSGSWVPPEWFTAPGIASSARFSNANTPTSAVWAPRGGGRRAHLKPDARNNHGPSHRQMSAHPSEWITGCGDTGLSKDESHPRCTRTRTSAAAANRGFDSFEISHGARPQQRRRDLLELRGR